MLINHSAKTNWFHLVILLGFTAVGVYFIWQAFQKPFVEFQKFNEVRAAEIKALDE